MPDEIVVSLKVTPEKICDGEHDQEVEATTQPPDTPVKWTLNNKELNIGQNKFNAGTITAALLGWNLVPGENKLTASLDNDVTVPVYLVVAHVEVELEPEPEVVYGNKRYVITAEPRMPKIVARAVGQGGTISALEGWTVKIVQNSTLAFETCYPNFPAEMMGEEDFSYVGDGGQISLDFGGKIRGGMLDVGVEATVGGCKVSGGSGAYLHCTNPQSADIREEFEHLKDALPEDEKLMINVDTLMRIACRESAQRQFDAAPNGGIGPCPLFGLGGRVGIMQIANPTVDEVWNWRANVARGFDRFREMVQKASAYPENVRKSGALGGSEVDLPDFTEQQLEEDAIRGYNGWFGTDGLGFELHEYRAVVEAGEAVWERVPVEDRPTDGAVWNDPDYVDSVLALLPGCGSGPVCNIEIVSTPAERSFSPPSLSGWETFRALITPSLPEGCTIVWTLVQGPSETGTVEFGEQKDTATMSSIKVMARHPNRAKIDVSIVQGGQTLCGDLKDISVPQFFHVDLDLGFLDTLEDLGLKRAPSVYGLTDDQVTTNVQVHDAVVSEIFGTVRSLFDSVNVRFVRDDPVLVVGAENYATVTDYGYVQEWHGHYGYCEPPSSGPNAGKTDVGNLDPTNPSGVFSDFFADRDNPKVTGDPTYLAIFGGLAVRDPDGDPDGNPDPTLSDGFAVDPGEFADPTLFTKLTDRQLKVRAAILAFSRLMADVIAHECGHSLGLPHNTGSTHHVMDEGPDSTLLDRTGIAGFDPATGKLDMKDLKGFSVDNLKTLRKILPVLEV